MKAVEEARLDKVLAPSKRSTIAWSMVPHRYHPTPSKDDDAVDGFTFRVNDVQRRLEIEELVIAREAFSENDAYSISDTSDVSVGDLDFDDVLPLKDLKEEEDYQCVDDPTPGTPDIVDLTEEILDQYLEMESSILNSSKDRVDAGGIPVSDSVETSKREVEFWTMSPKEGGSFTFDPPVVAACGLPKECSFTVGNPEVLKGDEPESPLNEDEDGSQIVEVDNLEFEERELLEDALWDLCLSSDEDEGDDVSGMNPPSPEEAAEAIFQAFSFPPYSDDEENSFKRSDPIPMVEPVSHVDNSNVRAILCQSWPMKTSSLLVTEKSPSIENLTTPCIRPDIDRFFPSFLGEELSFRETKRGLDSLRLNLNLKPSNDHSMRQSYDDLQETDDVLLEITDLSLSHMYESLDFMTELTSRLTAESLSSSPSSSEDYFSCHSTDDINTASKFDKSSGFERFTESVCISKQEMTVGDIESPFPAKVFESVAISSASKALLEPLCVEEEMPDYRKQAQISHVVTVNDIAQCESTCEARSEGSEFEDYIDALCFSDCEENLAVELSVGPLEDTDSMSAAVPVESDDFVGRGEQEYPTKQATEELPCTFVNGSDELQVAKQGYMSYVSQLSESCRDGDLMNYLDSVKLKKCYLWSMAPTSTEASNPTPDPEMGEMEKELSDLLLKPGELEKKWELDSQGSNETDELIEASSSLIKELNNRDLTASPGPDGSTGDWKDVIVLWLDQNGKDATHGTEVKEVEASGTDPLAPLVKDKVQVRLDSYKTSEILRCLNDCRSFILMQQS